jgi:hypothetical protein
MARILLVHGAFGCAANWKPPWVSRPQELIGALPADRRLESGA